MDKTFEFGVGKTILSAVIVADKFKPKNSLDNGVESNYIVVKSEKDVDLNVLSVKEYKNDFFILTNGSKDFICTTSLKTEAIESKYLLLIFDDFKINLPNINFENSFDLWYSDFIKDGVYSYNEKPNGFMIVKKSVFEKYGLDYSKYNIVVKYKGSCGVR